MISGRVYNEVDVFILTTNILNMLQTLQPIRHSVTATLKTPNNVVMSQGLIVHIVLAVDCNNEYN